MKIKKSDGDTNKKINPRFKKPLRVGKGNKPESNKMRVKNMRAIKKKQKYPEILQIKSLYEIIKKKSAKKEDKEQVTEKLYNLLKSNINSFVMAHDTARVVQCTLKKANPAIRKEISMLLLPESTKLALSKYSRNCVLAVMKYGDKTVREKCIESMFGSVCKLISSPISSSVIDTIYTTYANETQKNLMKQELYGEMYRNCKDHEIKKLSDVFNHSPQMKCAVLNAVKNNLNQIINKNIVDNSLVHTVLLEYLNECEEEDMTELITLCLQKIPLLLTTRDGCKAAILLFWNSSTKDRRAIVKSLKDHLIKICTHEYGHMFLIAVCNSMDDTKTIKKQLFDPLLIKIDEIIKCQWGRKVIEWLIAPASKENFHPHLIEFFDQGLKYGKKPSDIRRKEILELIEEPLHKAMLTNISFWMSNGHIGLLTATILKNLNSQYFYKVAESISKLITDCNWVICSNNLQTEQHNVNNKNMNDNNVCPGIEDPGLHIVLKKILKGDRIRISSNESTFGQIIVDNLASDTVKFWIKMNRACFILLQILENSKSEVKEKLISLMSNHVDELKNQNHIGAKLLLGKLNV